MSSTFSLLQYVVLTEEYEENLASHRYIAGKFLGTSKVLDVEEH